MAFLDNSGDIILENMRGESYIETLGGDIVVKDYSGDLDIKTNGGNVELEKVNGFIRAHSAGGNINISESEGVFSSSTIGGDIFMRAIKGEINSQSSGGSINLIECPIFCNNSLFFVFILNKSCANVFILSAKANFFNPHLLDNIFPTYDLQEHIFPTNALFINII